VLRTDAVRLVAVAAGGAIGATARWGISIAWPVSLDRFPTTTLAINLMGSFLLGLVVAGLLERRPAAPVTHTFLGTGLLGAFTTFSTLTVEAVVLVDAGQTWRAGAYLAVSLVAGVVLAAFGLALGRTWWVAR
jgi:CrcB protein